jgi:DNA-binding response OmpR family regulator
MSTSVKLAMVPLACVRAECRAISAWRGGFCAGAYDGGVRVVLLSDDAAGAAHVSALLARAGHEVLHVTARDAFAAALAAGGAELAIIDGANGGGDHANGGGDANGDGGDGGGDGDDAIALCEATRQAHPALAILLVTAAGDVDERVLGLDAGADDCLARPFAASQLVARVGALGRRAARFPPGPRDDDAAADDRADDRARAHVVADVIVAGGCRLDLGRAVAQRGTLTVQLTAREVALLRFLHRHRARAVPRAELLTEVWGVSPRNETRAVDVAIAELRRKIETDRAHPAIVRSVRGIGYAWGA